MDPSSDIVGNIEVLKEVYDEQDENRVTFETVQFPVRGTSCHIIASRLAYIPAKAISKFHDLTTLNLSFNMIEYIPEALVEGLPGLEHLYITNNKLAFLPSNIGLWKNLESLDAQNNKIRSIPDMANLRRLKQLNLQYNPLFRVWKDGFGDSWKEEDIRNAAVFARTFYMSLGLKESDINGSLYLADDIPRSMLLKTSTRHVKPLKPEPVRSKSNPQDVEDVGRFPETSGEEDLTTKAGVEAERVLTGAGEEVSTTQDIEFEISDGALGADLNGFEC